MRFLCFTLVLSASSWAVDFRPIESAGLGHSSCKMYEENKNNPEFQFAYKNWWAGYLTGLDIEFADGKSPELVGEEATNFILSISSYCFHKPQNTMKEAVDAYINEQTAAGYARLPNK
ncbi:hypothetical protein [Aliiglaciecola sp. NS0011-25]|uniref:hypothetical protein n=1 Tax=Aliiglaciecola sp. NS0011-25 TaxID=3127654 RepID=UPI003103034E